MGRGFKGFNRKSEGFLPWEQSFAYTGGMQSVVIPHTALYKLEVWGAQGGGKGNNYNVKGGGGNGGYSIGYVKLSKGETVYVCVGGAGGQGGCYYNGGGSSYTVAGGYNGGGSASYQGSQPPVPNYGASGGGGGATHMALVSGTLAEIGKTEFLDNGKGLVVAGGGSGTYTNLPEGGNYGCYAQGVGGGGTSGQNGAQCRSGNAQGSNPYSASGGTQSSGNAFGVGGNGAGGGLYGGHGHSGYAGWESDIGVYGKGCSGGGGSGYTREAITYRGRTYTPIMYTASNSGNGKAKITLVK